MQFIFVVTFVFQQLLQQKFPKDRQKKVFYRSFKDSRGNWALEKSAETHYFKFASQRDKNITVRSISGAGQTHSVHLVLIKLR